jgi:universal stress protein E
MKRFKNILYFADGPVRGAHAFDRAVALARTNQARLTVLDVIPEARVEWGLKERYGVRVTESIREQRLDELAVLTAPYTDAGTAVSTDVIIGTPFYRGHPGRIAMATTSWSRPPGPRRA